MLSKKAKYAMLALVHLAKREDDNPVVIKDIARAENIPQKFLEAILLDLRKAGILSSKKGKGGGYYLHKAPEDIALVEVMRLFDGSIALLPCVTYTYYERCEECKDEDTCGIRDAFLNLRNITVDFLKATTLQSIIEKESMLHQLKG
jgi:Rrf2 family protein